MMLPVNLHDNAIQAFQSMRMGKGDFKDCKFLVMKKHQEGNIQLDDELNAKCQTLEDLTNSLPNNETRFICYHLRFEMPKSQEHESAREGTRSKIVFLVWCPPATPVREKFQLAASTKTVKDKLNGIFVTHNASSKADLDEQQLIERCLTIMK
ncbi:hypothetical protein C9374_001063 [Naegleria lovaniensis]|uniref:ADF-H domain-containing protein n=1 Tax=Naegleria lovaniensis TaxID=51637 RepID=A0AA88GYY8_NAELO|nr:uncharacterized protein C9374_001063 [Naegleria lovaniensis]KAG2388213.1 hypothetical protein C9374_001063 [Naegleria lovaniensis]